VQPRVTVVGVDGCRAGWVVALAPLSRRGRVTFEIVDRIADVLALDVAAVAIDIPIGLPDAGTRACDIEARRRLGPRRSSVFPAPVRATLGAATFADALAAHRDADGRGLSQQAFHLLPKIAEVDAAIARSDQSRVREAHPELAFAVLAGAPLPHAKRTAAGATERLALLAPELGGVRPSVPRGAALDDVLDAVVLTTIARRIASGRATQLGDQARDATGLRMEILL
jgi:predicted RNase H-like nuclease